MNNRSTWGCSGEGCEDVEKGGHGLFQPAPQYHRAWSSLLFLMFLHSTHCSQTSMAVGLFSYPLSDTPVRAQHCGGWTTQDGNISAPVIVSRQTPLCFLLLAPYLLVTFTSTATPSRSCLPPPCLACFMRFVACGLRTGLIGELGGCS